MKRHFKLNNKHGMILIFALWTLAMLSILAFQIGLNARQKITMLSRIEKRTQLQNITTAGIQIAIAMLNDDYEENQLQTTVKNKVLRHNNRVFFKTIDLGEGTAEVSYDFYTTERSKIKRYGFVDEESKLNINTADFEEITRLVESVLDYEGREAEELAQAIIDWRGYGEKYLAGFFSDEYYDDLKYSYDLKRSDYESLEELKLIRGVDKQVYDKLNQFITIYGDGKVNFNTASRPVFYALGLDEALIYKILTVRNGEDTKVSTPDDVVFDRTSRFAEYLKQYVGLEQYEIDQIDKLNHNQKLTTYSTHFSINSKGILAGGSTQKIIRCVYNTESKEINYWREFN